MCGISGFIFKEQRSSDSCSNILDRMNAILKHRGPDDEGIWLGNDHKTGLAHVRLSIIDLDSGQQPMLSDSGNVIVYNGEIYNFIELREELGSESFKTKSDTEVLLKAYEKWGKSFVNRLRGMFAFAIWDNNKKELFCARDSFGIKPFYYTETSEGFFFASEAKALLMFQPEIETDLEALKEYLHFQFLLGEKTLFKGIKQLLPGHSLTIKEGNVYIEKYWEIYYNINWNLKEAEVKARTRELIEDSIKVHLRSDVPVGSYLSGGIDSSIAASLGSEMLDCDSRFKAFTGKFTYGEKYDESHFAKAVADANDIEHKQIDIKSSDFTDSIHKVIYHLDYPVAGPGAFPQYMVSQLASENVKTVLGGQGGDEIFGGYARYLIAYFEQCINGAIEGSLHNGHFVVTYESIIDSLKSLKEYKPLLKEFWSDGLFDSQDSRYLRLINRANSFGNEINWDIFNHFNIEETFKYIFWGDNIQKEAYFDRMTHFDFKTLLPALLHVEDRMSMAHGLESRVPFLDKSLVEFIATVPADIKFSKGRLKHLLKTSCRDILPEKIYNRSDKMGFPVPLNEWMKDDLRDFIMDLFSSSNAKTRPYLNNGFDISELISKEGKFTRRTWGLLCLEIWQQQFHDKSSEYRISN